MRRRLAGVEHDERADARARAPTSSATGAMKPVTFETWANATIRVRSVMSGARRRRAVQVPSSSHGHVAERRAGPGGELLPRARGWRGARPRSPRSRRRRPARSASRAGAAAAAARVADAVGDEVERIGRVGGPDDLVGDAHRRSGRRSRAPPRRPRSRAPRACARRGARRRWSCSRNRRSASSTDVGR